MLEEHEAEKSPQAINLIITFSFQLLLLLGGFGDSNTFVAVRAAFEAQLLLLLRDSTLNPLSLV